MEICPVGALLIEWDNEGRKMICAMSVAEQILYRLWVAETCAPLFKTCPGSVPSVRIRLRGDNE